MMERATITTIKHRPIALRLAEKNQGDEIDYSVNYTYLPNAKERVYHLSAQSKSNPDGFRTWTGPSNKIADILDALAWVTENKGGTNEQS